jgi:hypothetical protein
VELASGVHWFLKYFAGSSVSWNATGGLQLNHGSLTAASLAAMEAKGQVRIERAVPFSFYQNVVTMSYSMAFWDWDRYAHVLGACTGCCYAASKKQHPKYSLLAVLVCSTCGLHSAMHSV